MVDILEHLQKYVPDYVDENSKRIYLPVPIGGDQMTVTRIRSAQGIRVMSDSSHALRNLVPFAGDWHAKVNYMEVSIILFW